MQRILSASVTLAVLLSTPLARAQDIDLRLLIVASPSVDELTTTLPESIASTSLGAACYIELWASDVGETNTGVTSAYIDLSWPEARATAVNVEHGNIFTVFPTGTINAGLVDELGGSILDVVAVAPEWARVAFVEFTADANGPLTFTAGASATGVAAWGRGVIPWNEVSLDAVGLNVIYAGPMLYVDASATNGGDGFGWASAFNDLQDALTYADGPDGDNITELWVAAGTYTPAPPGGDRTATFQLLDNLGIYGGFAGTETELDQRDAATNITTLTADLNGDDVPDDPNHAGYDENSYHVVTGTGSDQTAVLEGFTVVAGNANGGSTDSHGAGLIYWSGQATVRDCSFRRNIAASNGGGILCNYGSNPVITGCSFSGNHAAIGSNLVIGNGSGPQIDNCAFLQGNVRVSGSTPVFSNCTFSGTESGTGSPAIYVDYSNAVAEFVNCTVVGNANRGVILENNSTAVLTNCILWDNGTQDETGQIHISSGTALLNHCCVQGWTGNLGGVGNHGRDPLFVDANGSDEIPGTPDDDLHLLPASPCINAGDNDIPSLPDVDFEGEPRIQQCRVDMGVDETPYYRDCNDNGVPDACDIEQGTSDDFNGNGIPDECEPPYLLVSGDAPVGGDGFTWPTALNDLQEALARAAASPGIVTDIWVAAGTYTPDHGTGDPDATFQLLNGVAMRGGFLGDEDPDTFNLVDRDFTANPSLLSGDLNSDDGPDFSNYGENSYYVVTASGTNASALLDGFCVRGANSSGIRNQGGLPVIVNTIIHANRGMIGAGMYNHLSANPTVINCHFIGNQAAYGGGGLATTSSCSATLTNCVFSGNTAVYTGGGVLAGYPNEEPAPYGTIILTNCAFSANDSNWGGGLRKWMGVGYLRNCIFWNNGTQPIYGSCVVTYSDVEGGYAGSGNIAINPRFVDADGGDDIYGTLDDDLRLSACSPCIDAGNNTVVPTDISDLDGDGDTTELVPLDLDGNPRFMDDVGTDDTGSGTPPIVDMGAYEFQGTTPPPLLFVDDDATGANNGTSWTDAFDSLQDALVVAAAARDCVTEIWVAAGTYTPTLPDGDRAISFQLRNDLAVYGGLAGDEDPNAFDLADRDLVANETILSGDLNADDDPNFAGYAENSSHVVTADYADTTALLDGFTITGGNANDADLPHNAGGGLRSAYGGPLIANCTFVANYAHWGGAVECYGSGDVSFSACTFTANAASSGGAVNNYQTNASFTDCTFSDNQADIGGAIRSRTGGSVSAVDCAFARNSAFNGGAVWNSSTSVTATGCTFTDNVAEGHGAGVYACDASTLALQGSVFRNNQAAYGGGVSVLEAGTVNLTNCTFEDNTASGSGGGVFTRESNTTLTDCDWLGNSADASGGALTHEGGPLSVTGGSFTENSGSSGGGIHLGWYGTPTLDTCTFTQNSAVNGGGVYISGEAHPTLTDCVFDTNYATSHGGGVYAGWDGSPTFNNCNFTNNNATWRGGGIRNWGTGTLTLNTCTFSVNSANSGGALDCSGGPSLLTACEFTQNSATSEGGAFNFHDGATSTLEGCNFTDNTAAFGGAITAWDPPDATVSNCTFARNSCDGAGGAVWNAAGTVALAGCTFDDNVAHGDGGGVYCGQATPSFSGCAFNNNLADYAGGAVFADDNAAPEYANCTFTGNHAGTNGGAVLNDNDSTPIITQCTFSGNTAERGGAIANWSNCAATLADCELSNNQATLDGGALFHGSSGTVALSECTFMNNSAAYAGGAMFADNYTTAGFDSCTFTGNSAETAGGALLCDAGTVPTLTACALNGNSAGTDGGGIALWDVTGGDLSDCTFIGNSANGTAGAILVSGGQSAIANCTFRENTAEYHGGAVRVINQAGPTLTGCTFIENSSNNYGGALNIAGNSDPIFTNCAFIANAATVNGGGLDIADNSIPVLVNCVFIGNIAETASGGAIWNVFEAASVLVNCTVVGNVAAFGGGVANGTDCSPSLTNCILWGNRDDSGAGESAQIHRTGDWPTVDYCCVQGWTGVFGGTGNTGDDPAFVDPDGPDEIPGTEDDNLRLRVGSPAIDAADNTALPPDTRDLDNDGNTAEPIPLDLDGEPRCYDHPDTPDTGVPDPNFPELGIVDMGAYEGPGRHLLITGEPVTVPEGGAETFYVALARDPQATIEVAVAHHEGDQDISVLIGDLLAFDSSNYSTPQLVLLLAATDGDWLNGEAIIRVSAPDMTPEDVLATEADSDAVPPVVFVDASATGASNGTSWIDAFTELRNALSALADRPGTAEVWVAATGTYTPDSPDGDRTATFPLLDGVGLYGGFAGGETSLDQRDPQANETILSGDLNADDDPNFVNNDENSYHVVTGSDSDQSAVLDGFTITGGNANHPEPPHRDGGGMITLNGNPTVNNCRFVRNAAYIGAGLLFSESGSNVTNCVISENVAEFSGGGMQLVDSDATFTNCLFGDNAGGVEGGGLRNHRNASTFTDCVFTGNWAAESGGGLHNTSGNLSLTRCTFTNNTAQNTGGGMRNDTSANPVLIDCTFSGNIANGNGGGILNHDDANPTLVNCTFTGNTADNNGGGMVNRFNSNPELLGCRFGGNTAVLDGGGMFNKRGNPTLTNCLFSMNSADNSGGGIYNDVNAAPVLTNCTFASNVALSEGGGLCNSSESALELTNCILWRNQDAGGSDESAQLAGGTPVVDYSCLQGWTGVLGGTANHGADPSFADPDNQDFHLRPGSSGIDSGNNEAVPASVTTDLDGNPRFLDDPGMPDSGHPPGAGPLVDRGAYEFQGETCFGDLDGDDYISLADLAQLLGHYGTTSGAVYGDGDLDGDGDVDLSDLADLLGVYGTTCP